MAGNTITWEAMPQRPEKVKSKPFPPAKRLGTIGEVSSIHMRDPVYSGLQYGYQLLMKKAAILKDKDKSNLLAKAQEIKNTRDRLKSRKMTMPEYLDWLYKLRENRWIRYHRFGKGADSIIMQMLRTNPNPRAIELAYEKGTIGATQYRTLTELAEKKTQRPTLPEAAYHRPPGKGSALPIIPLLDRRTKEEWENYKKMVKNLGDNEQKEIDVDKQRRTEAREQLKKQLETLLTRVGKTQKKQIKLALKGGRPTEEILAGQYRMAPERTIPLTPKVIIQMLALEEDEQKIIKLIKTQRRNRIITKKGYDKLMEAFKKTGRNRLKKEVGKLRKKLLATIEETTKSKPIQYDV